jgi:nitroreductase
MEFLEVLKSRRSVRKFKPTKIADETVRKILQLAQLAPSAGNLQAYRVRVVKSAEEKRRLRKATMSKQKSLASAPAVLVICANGEESEEKYGERGRNLYSIQDATIFASYLQLVMASMNLASVWVGAFSEEEAKRALTLPENLRPVIMLPFGYPDEEGHLRERKKLDDVIV